MNKIIIAVLHAVIQGAVWVVPVLLASHPEIADVTVSTIFSVGIAYLNNHYLTNNG